MDLIQFSTLSSNLILWFDLINLSIWSHEFLSRYHFLHFISSMSRYNKYSYLPTYLHQTNALKHNSIPHLQVFNPSDREPVRVDILPYNSCSSSRFLPSISWITLLQNSAMLTPQFGKGHSSHSHIVVWDPKSFSVLSIRCYSLYINFYSLNHQKKKKTSVWVHQILSS